MIGSSASARAVALAIAIAVVAGGGSFAVSRYVIAQAQEEGKGLAQQRAIERSAQKDMDKQAAESAERTKRLTRLLSTLEDSLASHPLDSMMVVSAANISYDLGKFDKAARYYEIFLGKIDPSNTAVRIDYAYALFQMGRKEDGMAELKGIISREPKNQSALFNLAVMYAQMDNVGEALRWFTTCKKADSTSMIGQRAALAIQQLETTT
jgi:tetratricopeptide (TPR) repeat protein